MSTTADALFEVNDGIGLLTFNRPDARNALTMGMYERVHEVCSAPPEEFGMKALVITGAGEKAFAAGTDISQFRDFDGAQDAINYEANIDRILSAVERCPIPTIAAIAGACVGGGAGIAAACDLRIATHDLKFGFPIARTLGNCLSAATLARLCALLGAGRVREILFTSRLIRAEEAAQIGLVSELLDGHAALMQRAKVLAETIAGHAPLTLQVTKESLRRLAQHDVDDEDLIVKCYTSSDFREGLEAFLEKRKPQWRGH